jgi:tetratricopeptide (TPR) repeat protein
MRKKKQQPKSKSSNLNHQAQKTSRPQKKTQLRLRDVSGRGFPPYSIRQKLVNKIRSINPESRTFEDWYTLGSLLVYEACLDDDELLMNEGSEALVIAAEAEPPISDAVLDLTWLLNLRGLPSVALRYAKQATELMPNVRDSWYFRANTHMQLKQRDQAIDCLKIAVKLPDAIPADQEMLSRLEANIEQTGGRGVLLFGPMIQEFPLGSTSEVNDEIIKLHLFYTRQIAAITPNNVLAIYSNALGYYKLNQFENAERQLAQVFVLASDHADALCMQALIHQKRGEIDQSAEYYIKAIKSDGDHVLANTNYASILLDQMKPAEARIYLETALHADPKYAVALTLYGNTIAYIEGDFKRESEYHAKALYYGPATPAMRFSRCISLLQAGEFWQLEKEWRKHSPYLISSTDNNRINKSIAFLQTIVPLVLNPPSDFSLCVSLAERFSENLGGLALTPILMNAWKLRNSFSDQDGLNREACEWLGLVASKCKCYELALKVFGELENIEGKGGTESLNVAVTLGSLNRYDEALEIAKAVRPGTNRVLTIQANLLRNAGMLLEALEKYLQASIIERDFYLPISNGIDLAIQLVDIHAVRSLVEATEGRFSDIITVQYSLARAKMLLGYPKEAAQILRELLYANDEPFGLLEENNEQEESGESKDLTISGRTDENEMFYSLGVAYLKSRQFNDLFRLAHWIATERSINGNWTILIAEAHRYLGEHADSLELLNAMTVQPPPLASKCLIAAAEANWFNLRITTNELFSEDFKDMLFLHPEGIPLAIGHATRSMGILADGFVNEAILEAKSALQVDLACGLAYISLSKAYEESGDSLAAITNATNGLIRVPGDPGLIEWVIEKLIDMNNPTEADELLTKYRDNLISRGMNELTFWLGEQVARAKLSSLSPNSNDFDELWVSQLEPESREWLSAAFVGNQNLSQLRLGIAMYYCKIVERELTSKIVNPFVISRPSYDPSEFDKDLKDIQRCLETGRYPGLGSIAHSLGVASRPSRSDDSRLLISWRTYLRNRPEPQFSALRSRDFIDNLRNLADVRNRVAHLGNMTQDEFVRVEISVINNRKPGSIMRSLGIG